MRQPKFMDVNEHDNCNCDQALALIVLVNRLVKERDEARKLAEYWFGAVCDPRERDPREREQYLLPWEDDEE